MKKHYPSIAVALGILLFVAGILYSGFVGGIPGPDDSPAEAAHVAMHNMIGFGVLCVGVLCFLGGTVAGVVRLFLVAFNARHTLATETGVQNE